VDCLLKFFTQSFRPLFLGALFGLAKGNFPVFLCCYLAVLHHKPVSRKQFLYRLKHGSRGGDISKGQVFAQRLKIHAPGHNRIREDGLDFRGEQKPLWRDMEIQRLDSQTVSRHQESALPAVPDGKAVHAA